MKILTMTTLYPNAAAPTHGVFVENRLRAFRDFSAAEIRVVAPVPWFPSGHPRFGDYARFARAPARETRHGIDVTHPRFAVIPKIGMTAAATTLAACFLAAARNAIAEGYEFDLIDAHYLYPDAVAAVRVARKLGKPVAITARGTDVSLIPDYPRQRTMILNAVAQADATICVAEALKNELVRRGATPEKIRVLRNGVDLDLFRPVDRIAAREAIDLRGPVIASVGHLIERKGHDLAIETLVHLPEATLLIVGEGPDETRLRSVAATLGVADRVRFLGRIAHESLPMIYTAADALVLASSREGWPNVLLEAMACGTPAVASPVWGNGEVIAAPAAGRIAATRSGHALAISLGEVLRPAWDREKTRHYAEAFSWTETSLGLQSLFVDILDRSRRTARVSMRPISLPRQAPIRMPAIRVAQRPRLLITIDAEEEFDWTGFGDSARSISVTDYIDRLHRLCAARGARPLYFLTYPLIADRDAAAYFKGCRDRGEADLGVLIHQWSTPPITDHGGAFYSWQCNLPFDIQKAKLSAAADAFENAFGVRPLAHRAGRYGITPSAYAALAAAGIRMDFSPSPGFDDSKTGGPDFSTMANLPFSLRADPAAEEIVVIPVSGARGIRSGGPFLPPHRTAGFQARAPSLVRASTPMRLSCENASLRDLKALTRRLIAERGQVLTFSVPSTALTPRRNQDATASSCGDGALSLTEAYLDYFTGTLGGMIIDLETLCREAGIAVHGP